MMTEANQSDQGWDGGCLEDCEAQRSPEEATATA